MKRKLNDSDVPTPTEDDKTSEKPTGFATFELDSRLLQAIAKQNFAAPTDVQFRTIPLALSGKDILVRSKTGSGKSAAYILPILQSILKRKTAAPKEKSTSALVLVPTKELAQQITKAVLALTAFCNQEIKVVNLTQKVAEPVQRSLLVEQPDIVVSTPSRIPQNLSSGALNAETLQNLVIDEADLVLSYGYENDFEVIAKAIPKGIQTSLVSATLTTEVDTLKTLFSRDPVIVDLQEKEDEAGGVSQYVVRCAEEEKFLLLYVVYKLKLIKGKSIIFVADTNRCYRLKLFLEQFGISSCVLNSELPVNSRIHVVEEFNKNVYDIILASDEHEVLGDEECTRRLKSGSEAGAAADQVTELNGEEEATLSEKKDANADPGENEIPQPPPSKKKKPSKKSKRAKEYGISRGIDFQNVACVLNFDLPTSSTSYTHRIGRTARAGKTGMALSFVIPASLHHLHPPTSISSTIHDEETLGLITSDQASRGKELKPYHFDMKQVNAFKYRMNDALRAVTGDAILEARRREIRNEVLNSEKLKRFWEENPQDLEELLRLKRHDADTGAVRVQRHLRHVPDYLMPKGGAKSVVKDVGFVPFTKDGGKSRVSKRSSGKRKVGGGRAGGRKGRDPLKGLGRK